MKNLRFAALLLFSACLDSEIINDQGKGRLHVENDRLVFENPADLTRTINQLSSMTEEGYTNWSRRISGFSSFRYTGQTLGVAGSEFEHSPAFLAILNRQGLYQVGNEVILVRGFTEYIVTAGDEGRVKKMMADPKGTSGVKTHNIRFAKLNDKSAPNGKTAGVDARYQREAMRQIDLGLSPGALTQCPSSFPLDIGNYPYPKKYKYVFESYYVNHSSFIELGVKIKMEEKTKMNIPGTPNFIWTGWVQSSQAIAKSAEITFAGFTYYPAFDVFQGSVSLGNSSNQPLVLSISIPGHCISDFRINGIMSITSKDGGTYFCPYKYKVNGPNATESYANNLLWNDITYCPTGIPGGGGGGGGGGVEDPPPVNCENGCVWGGSECVCP